MKIRAGHVLMLLIVSVAPGCSEGEEADGALLIDTGVILDNRRLEQLSTAAGLVDVSAPYWTPTAEQASAADRAVLYHLRQVNTAQSRQITDAIGDYKRQYIGYTVSGKKWMLVMRCANHIGRIMSLGNRP